MTPSQPLIPKTAPNDCCREDANLGLFELNAEQPGPVTDSLTGETVAMVAGFRRCKVCNRRHHFARRRDFFLP